MVQIQYFVYVWVDCEINKNVQFLKPNFFLVSNFFLPFIATMFCLREHLLSRAVERSENPEEPVVYMVGIIYPPG